MFNTYIVDKNFKFFFKFHNMLFIFLEIKRQNQVISKNVHFSSIYFTLRKVLISINDKLIENINVLYYNYLTKHYFRD